MDHKYASPKWSFLVAKCYHSNILVSPTLTKKMSILYWIESWINTRYKAWLSLGKSGWFWCLNNGLLSLMVPYVYITKSWRTSRVVITVSMHDLIFMYQQDNSLVKENLPIFQLKAVAANHPLTQCQHHLYLLSLLWLSVRKEDDKNHYHRLSVWQTDCSHGWAGTRKLVNVYFHLHEFSFLPNEVNLCPVFEDIVFKILSYFKLCTCSVSMGGCVRECRCLQRPKEDVDPLDLELQAPVTDQTRVQGTKLLSSASALYCWTLSPDHFLSMKKL